MLEFFLNTPTLALAAVTLVAPWRWVWRLWLLLLIAAAALFSFSPRVPDPGVGYAFGLPIVFTYGVVFTSLLAVRAGVQILISRKPEPRKQLSNIEKSFLGFCEALLFVVGGVVAAGFVIWILAYTFSTIPGGYVIHGLVGLISLAAVIVLAWRQIRARSSNWREAAFAFPFSSLMVAVSIYGFLHPTIVLAEAERIAGDAPFCIAFGKQHRPVRLHQDLTFFTMYKGSARHHAILLVDRAGIRERFHWSYRQRRFVQGSIGSAIACRPTEDFAAGLGNEYYFGGRRLIIPEVYHPQIYIPDDKKGVEILMIYAMSPEFRPARGSSTTNKIWIQIQSQAWLEGEARRVVSKQATGHLADLIEVRDGPSGRAWFYKLDAEGRIASLIRCPGKRSAGGTCQHRFYKNGVMYMFFHSLRFLADSTEMENRLHALFDSFTTPSAARR